MKILVLTAALLAQCTPGAGLDDRPAEAPNIVLIVMDTVRSDHLGCYGYERNTSPRIDAFANSATRYLNSVAASPWTIPSHASMFTGEPPYAHGAHTFEVDKPVNNVNPLSRDHVTLAEALREEGYQAGAFVANAGFLALDWQLDQGFDTYHVEFVWSDKLNEHVFSWLNRVDRPFFLFVNYIDAHRPYNTRPRPDLIDPPAVTDDGQLLDRLIGEVLPGERDASSGLVGQVIDQYDTGIANLDENVGELLDRLSRSGLDDDTVIIITSDHGEYFGEHRLVEHSKDVYQEALNVPLLIRSAGQQRARVVDTPVVSYDLPRLIASELTVDLEERLAPLFPSVPGEHPIVSENYFTRFPDLFNPRWGHRFQRIRRSVFDWPFKLIQSSDGRSELYALDDDPTEANNLIDAKTKVAKRLAETLDRYLQAQGQPMTEPNRIPIAPDLRKKLEALGYLEP